MRQLVYISTATSLSDVNLTNILPISQRNNARVGVTGLLYFNGRRFLQALEGEQAAVETTLTRIRADPRHRAVVILSDRAIVAREFGAWTMADATANDDLADLFERIDRLVANAAPTVRANFTSFARLAA